MKKISTVIGIIPVFFLSGCVNVDESMDNVESYVSGKLASYSVPFEWFKSDIQEEPSEEEKWSPITPLTLPSGDATEKVRVSAETMLEELMGELNDEEKMMGFLEGEDTSRTSFKSFRTLESSVDVFGDIIRQVYATPYQRIQSITLTGIGEQQVGDEEFRAISVTLNSVNDTKKFLQHDVMLLTDEKNNIRFVKLNQETDRENTLTPLTSESEWSADVHKEFKYKWDEIISFPPVDDWRNVGRDEIAAWLSKVGVTDQESVETVFTWYRVNEGDMKKAVITGYLHTDENASAITMYEVKYPQKHGDAPLSFSIFYDRGNHKIIGFGKETPFNKKGES